jgi:hypothetical protein
MAKLYAELSSDKGGRIASKGGDRWLELAIYRGNRLIRRFNVDDQGTHVDITEYTADAQHVQTTQLT